jgi:membrane protein
MIAIGLLIAPSMEDRIVECGEDSVAVIEMSPESWFVVGIVPGISRAPLQKLHRWREEASTWLWPVNVGPMWTELSQAIDPIWRNWGPLETLRPKREAFVMSWWALTKEAAASWVNHKDAQLGAALAYYSIFSLGPLMVIAIAIAGLVFGQEAVRGEVGLQLKGLLGDAGAQAVDAMLVGASKPQQGIVATVLGIGLLLLAAVGVVVQLKDALNTVWEVEARKKGGTWQFVRTYLVSLAGVLALGFLLLVSLLLSTALSASGKYLSPHLPEATLHIVGSIISFGVITLLFAMMFKWLPDTSVRWRDVWLGAAITAALFEIGKLLISVYIGKQALESTYGAAASLVVLLIWIYYSSQVVLMGAEFTHVYTSRRGPRQPGCCNREL